MRGAVMHAPGDVDVLDRPDPKIMAPTDAVVRLLATCICGSDLWPWRGIEGVSDRHPWDMSTWGWYQRSETRRHTSRSGTS